ncbi:MAG: hypothetical protein U0527_06155 [Candidatus Eisenbacteria bacterium]
MIRRRHALVLLLASFLALAEGDTIRQGLTACLSPLAPRPARAESELEAARGDNWERLCVLGFSSVVARVLAQLPLELEAGAPRGVRGKGPTLWVERDQADLVIMVDESRGPAKSATPDSIDDAVLVDHDADGVVDRVVDWVDLDHDGAPIGRCCIRSRPGFGTRPAWPRS